MMDKGFKPLFTGDSFDGWRIFPRDMLRFPEGSAQYQEAMRHPGLWTIRDGVVEGRQDPPGSGFGSYLVSEDVYGDFELIFEAKPDWPADTGVYLRASKDGSIGYQVLLDHRKSGSIGGYYGNAIGGFHAINWNVDAVYDDAGNAVGIKSEDPADTIETITPDKPALLDYKISPQEFIRLWKWNEWNAFRLVCRGKLPVLTTYINDVKVTSIDMSRVESPKFDREKALQLGEKGHISFEVHDNDPGMGEARWGKTAACRWRNVYIKEL